MTGRLKDKVAIVVGAGAISAGIGNGKATAIVFAREGARVVLADINLEAAVATKRIIDAEGGDCIAIKADVTDPADCHKMVANCIRTSGRVDILHNNVGVLGAGGLLDTSEALWDRIIRTNLTSMFFTCRCALPYMLEQGGGVIINVSSIGGIRVPQPGQMSYAVTKGAIIAFTNEIAIEFAARGIRANCILPGLIKTPLVEWSYNPKAWGGRDVEEMWRKRDSMSPTGKQGEAWDIADAALFLASDEAKYVNGVSLLVDGGLAGTIKTFRE